MRVITSFVLVLLLTGCAGVPLAHLNQKEATQTAVAVAQKAGYRLDEYQSPTVVFDSKERGWRFYFDHKPPGFPGGYIRVFIDDKTGDGKLLPSD